MEMKVKDKLVESLDSDDYVNTTIHPVEDESAIMFRFSTCGRSFDSFHLLCCVSDGGQSSFLVIYICSTTLWKIGVLDSNVSWC